MLRNFLVRRSFSWDTGLTNSAKPPPLPLHDIAAQSLEIADRVTHIAVHLHSPEISGGCRQGSASVFIAATALMAGGANLLSSPHPKASR